MHALWTTTLQKVLKLGKQIWIFNLFLIITKLQLTCVHIFLKRKMKSLMLWLKLLKILLKMAVTNMNKWNLLRMPTCQNEKCQCKKQFILVCHSYGFGSFIQVLLLRIPMSQKRDLECALVKMKLVSCLRIVLQFSKLTCLTGIVIDQEKESGLINLLPKCVMRNSWDSTLSSIKNVMKMIVNPMS